MKSRAIVVLSLLLTGATAAWAADPAPVPTVVAVEAASSGSGAAAGEPREEQPSAPAPADDNAAEPSYDPSMPAAQDGEDTTQPGGAAPAAGGE